MSDEERTRRTHDLVAWIRDPGSDELAIAEAFGELTMLWQPTLQGFLNDEDLVQDTLVSAFRSIRRFEAKSEFLTWLIAIALNVIRQEMRRRRRRERVRWALSVFVKPIPPIDQLSPERRYRSRELLALLEMSAEELSIFIRKVEGYTAKEIAKKLGTTVGSVNGKTFRAKEEAKTKRSELERLPDAAGSTRRAGSGTPAGGRHAAPAVVPYEDADHEIT